MIKATVHSYLLNFKQPAGTSRGVLRTKESFFLRIEDPTTPFAVGLGEVGVLRGLSVDDVPELESRLAWTAENIHLGLEVLYARNSAFPSIQFALEQAFSHLQHGFHHFETPFSRGEQGQAINGLIWMGTKHFMLGQIQRRLEEGFGTLKMKVGAISWADELALLKGIRERFSSRDLTMRVDANGAFSRSSIDPVLHELAALEVHSIEQPLPTTDRDGLSEVCAVSPIPVALDESLIGMFSKADKELLLDTVRPQYIILKPSFIGGWHGADEWIECAAARGIDWWATSALESTVGMNAIAQWTATKHLHTPQGLGTGSLYTNNIPGPLEVKKGELWTAGDVQTSWSLPESLQTFR